MTKRELAAALRLCGSTPEVYRCQAGCPFYRVANPEMCIPAMTSACADALENHESHVMALRREIEKLRAKMEALLDENERLKADKDKNASIKWVSVAERLPGYNRHVLCYRPDMAMKIVISSYDGYYADDDEEWYEGWSIYGYDLNGNCVITHWMPLPSTEGVE